MADYIKRDAVIDRIERHVRRIEDEIYQLSDEDKIFNRALDLALEIIGNEPAANVRENVPAHWIFDCERVAGDGWTYKQRHCSNCGFQTAECVNFCQNCGADMRQVDNE